MNTLIVMIHPTNANTWILDWPSNQDRRIITWIIWKPPDPSIQQPPNQGQRSIQAFTLPRITARNSFPLHFESWLVIAGNPQNSSLYESPFINQTDLPCKTRFISEQSVGSKMHGISSNARSFQASLVSPPIFPLTQTVFSYYYPTRISDLSTFPHS